MHKKWNYLVFLVSLCAYPSLASPKPHAQAQKILAGIKTPAKFQADFTYSRQEKGEKEPQEFQGKVWVKAHKYRLVLDEQIIVSNGEVIWSYLPAFHEVHIHACESEKESEFFSPLQLLSIYQQGFIPIALQQVASKQEMYDVIELLAKDTESFITHLSLAIGKKTHQIKNIKALDNHGTVHKFVIIDLVSVEIENSYFEFDIAGGNLEIIDLR